MQQAAILQVMRSSVSRVAMSFVWQQSQKRRASRRHPRCQNQRRYLQVFQCQRERGQSQSHRCHRRQRARRQRCQRRPRLSHFGTDSLGGVFKFTHKAIGKGGAANPGWQVICPFHAVSEKTKCTRFLTLSELSLRGEDEVIRCLQMWAQDAPNHNRARWHQSEPSIPGLLPPADVVDEILRASRIDSMPEGFVLKDDVELARLAAVAFSGGGRGRGRANAPGAGGGRAGRGAGRGRTGASTGAASSSAGPSASSASAGIAVAGAALAAAGDIAAVVPAVPVEHSSSSNGSNSSNTSSDSSSS